MVNIVPVDRERHAGKGWRPSQDYSFAAQQVVVRLVGAEVTAVAIAMPIAFVEQSGSYVMVGLMSPMQGRNFFVAPNGQWLSTFVPSALRTYPFSLARIEGRQQIILCIDEDSGRVVDAGVNADVTKFFDEQGNPSAATRAMLDYLQQVESNRLATDLAVAGLADAHVLEPWPLAVQDEKKQEVSVQGLFRINEPALNALDDQAYLKLRKLGALGIAQAQLISMQAIAVFRQLAVMQRQIAAQQAQPESSPSPFKPVEGGTLPIWKLS